MNKLTALIEAAKAATPGPWMWPNVGSSDFVISGPGRLAIGHLDSPRTAEFVALANPATILELCTLLEKAESDLNEAGDQLSTIVHLDGTCKRIYTLGVHLNKALAAIKQWKEQT